MTPEEILAWLNNQTQTTLNIYIRTTLVGVPVRIFDGHRCIGSGETVEEAVQAAKLKLAAEQKR